MRLRDLLAAAAATVLVAAAPASAAFPHVVAPGESLSSVAASDGLSVGELAAANGLSPEESLTAGSTLMIPPAGAAGTEGGASEAAPSGEAAAQSASGSTGEEGDEDADQPEGSAAAAGSTASGGGSYAVQSGDTLSAIAMRAGTSLAELAAANGLDPNATLLAGAVLTLPGASTEVAPPGSSGSEAAASQPEGSEAEGSSSAPPYPTAETVSASEVGTIAAENGVPPSLAEAVAYQESGFNNEVTSSSDARGVMQILPGTWSWIGESLSEAPLAPASAASNVRAGVLMLHSLLDATGGDAGLAAAGYYQGLPSVLQEGELPETEQYVSEVLAKQHEFGGG